MRSDANLLHWCELAKGVIHSDATIGVADIIPNSLVRKLLSLPDLAIRSADASTEAPGSGLLPEFQKSSLLHHSSMRLHKMYLTNQKDVPVS